MSHRSFSAAAAVAVLTLSAGGAAAQACLGLPTRDGQVAVAGMGDFSEIDRYGAEFNVDVTGPAAIGFSYGADTSDGGRRVFAGRVSYDFFLVEPSICAVAGLRFANDEAPDVDERLGVPVGIGFGKRIRGDRFSTTVFAVPQYVWLREKRLASDDVVTSNEFQAEAGVTLGFVPFYVGGAIVVTTIDEADPAFRIRAGLTF